MTAIRQEIVLHTPGPWSCAPIWRGPETKVHAEFEGRRVALAEVFTMHEAGEKEANARLIAAAPDLLRALIDLGDWLAYGMSKADGAEPTAEDHAACERVSAQARAAVDKATGAA